MSKTLHFAARLGIFMNGPIQAADRTKVFHVKRFCPIDDLRERTFRAWRDRQNRDLAQTQKCNKIYTFRIRFLRGFVSSHRSYGFDTSE